MGTILLSTKAYSQTERKVVMQVNSSDTLVYKSLGKQLHHMREADPTIQIEVVCHGPGMDLLQLKNQEKLQKQLDEAKGHLSFVACENTMKEKKIEKASLATNIVFVPAGLIEVIDKQSLGWSYIKVGF